MFFDFVNINEVVIVHRDRLCRFGYELLEDMITKYSYGLSTSRQKVDNPSSCILIKCTKKIRMENNVERYITLFFILITISKLFFIIYIKKYLNIDYKKITKIIHLCFQSFYLNNYHQIDI